MLYSEIHHIEQLSLEFWPLSKKAAKSQEILICLQKKPGIFITL